MSKAIFKRTNNFSSNSKSLEFLWSSRSEVRIPVLPKIFHKLLLSCFRINNYFMWFGKIVRGYDTDATILNNATLFSSLFATFSLGHFPFGIFTFGLFPWHHAISFIFNLQGTERISHLKFLSEGSQKVFLAKKFLKSFRSLFEWEKN